MGETRRVAWKSKKADRLILKKEPHHGRQGREKEQGQEPEAEGQQAGARGPVEEGQAAEAHAVGKTRIRKSQGE